MTGYNHVEQLTKFDDWMRNKITYKDDVYVSKLFLSITVFKFWKSFERRAEAKFVQW